jgi:hypothetical protein
MVPAFCTSYSNAEETFYVGVRIGEEDSLHEQAISFHRPTFYSGLLSKFSVFLMLAHLEEQPRLDIGMRKNGRKSGKAGNYFN